MNRIRIFFLSLFFFLLIVLFPRTSLAHPGRTAGDGCHYCRTNCDSWGVAWNARHCHGGSSSTPTPKPTNTPTPSPTQAPEPTPEAKGETTEITPIPTEVKVESDEVTTEATLSGVSILSTLGVIGGGYWLFKRFKKKNEI